MTASTTNRPQGSGWSEVGAPTVPAAPERLGEEREDREPRVAREVRAERRLRRILRQASGFPRPTMRTNALSWWREVLLVAVLYTAYEFTRGLHQGGFDEALENGQGILDWEHLWHLDPETYLNNALNNMTWLAVLASYFYSTMHYVVTPAVLIWMYRRHSDHYRTARTTLAIATISGLVGFYVIPTAPPRLLEDSGITDTLETVSDWGWWSGDGSVPRGLGGLSNQFAAMPSLHVGWAVWSGVLLAMYASRRWVRVLGVLYPLATSVVVMATGNHYLLDVFAGLAVIAWGALGAGLVNHWRHGKPDETASADESASAGAPRAADLELAG